MAATQWRSTNVLTAREREVLELSATGLPSAEMAERLFVAKSTVDYHLCGAYKKLGARNRLEALRTAQEMGLISLVLGR